MKKVKYYIGCIAGIVGFCLPPIGLAADNIAIAIAGLFLLFVNFIFVQA